jgi:hydrogenase expression/formation protein HypC
MCLGIPGQVVEIRDPVSHVGVVDVEGVRREISLSLLSDTSGCDVTVGDWVLVHVGFAMAQIDEQEAAQTLAALRALGDVYSTELSDLSMQPQLDRSLDGPLSAERA